MPPADHFSAVAQRYARFRPRYPRALYEWLAAAVPGRTRVWDCGCGSGQASVALADHFDEVVATDLSAGQLAEAPAHPRIRYQVALAEASGLGAASCDLVTAAQALHWFELERFYAEARRVLRADGLLAVWCYGPCAIPGAHGDALLRHYYAEIVGPYWPAERSYVDQGYRTLAFPQPEIAVPAFGMTLEWTLDELLGYVSSWSATARYVKAQGADPLPALRAALAPQWGDAHERHRVSWPLSVRAAHCGARAAAPAAERRC